MTQQNNTFSYTYMDVLHECRRYVYKDLEAEELTKNIYKTVQNASGTLLNEVIREALETLGDDAPLWDCLPDIMLKVWLETPRDIPEAAVAQILKKNEEFEAAAKAFESLPPSQSLFLKLRAVDGLSIEEIANNFHMVPTEVVGALEAARDAFWGDFLTALWNLYQGNLLSQARRRIGANSYEGDSFEDARSKMWVKFIEAVRRIRPLNFGAWLTNGVKLEADEIVKKSNRRRSKIIEESKEGNPAITQVDVDDESDDALKSKPALVLGSPSKTTEPLEHLTAEEELPEKRKEMEKEINLQNDCLKTFLEVLTDAKKPTELLFVFIRYYLNNSPIIADFDKGLIPAQVNQSALDIAEGLAVADLAQKKQTRTEYALKPLSQASIAAAIGISEKTIQRRYEELRERLAYCCQQFGIEISRFDTLGKYQQLIRTEPDAVQANTESD